MAAGAAGGVGNLLGSPRGGGGLRGGGLGGGGGGLGGACERLVNVA